MKIDNDLYKYIYDDLYNITHIYLNNELINEYTYDNINELIEEKNYTLNRLYKFTYDKEGNIQKKQEYELSTHRLLKEDTYEYNNPNWEDQLTKFNNESITYDNIGNPLTIGDTTLTWTNGRQLQTYTENNLNISYTYNIDGIRTSKTSNGITTNYYLEGRHIIFEKTGTNMIYYIRDENGELIGLRYNNNTYFYKKNYQGDIIGIYDSNYDIIVNYSYDSWGNILSITDNNNNEITDPTNIGLINPYRYRSYYYDTETKLYYLNSRYYNPVWGRFINSDIILTQNSQNNLGMNLYIYCLNNPVKFNDNNGNLFEWVGKLWNNAKKVVNDISNWVKQHFTAELSSGVGLGGSNGILSAEVSKTFDFGYSNGQSYTSTSRGFDISVGVTETASIGASINAKHYTSIDGIYHGNSIDHGNIMEFYSQIEDCKYTIIEKQLGFSQKITKSNDLVEISANEDPTFIGLNVSIFYGVGVKIKIGFNI